MRIVFMGTPEFAVPSLRLLHSSAHEVVGVVTQPDRPKGRGLKTTPPPLKVEAVNRSIPVLQPENLLDPTFLGNLAAWNGRLFVVVGFRILPPEIFEMPEKGTINLHASLLPKYRGSAPIQWALMHGEKETGVTTFFINRNVDTGNLIFQVRVPIKDNENAGELHDRLSETGANLVLKTVDAIERDTASASPQSGEPSKAPKITLEDCRIDWRQSAASIQNKIRGLSPRPGAFTSWDGKRLKLLRAALIQEKKTGLFGTVIGVEPDGIDVQTGKGCLRVLEVQLEGGRMMKTGDFLRGHKIKPGNRFY